MAAGRIQMEDLGMALGLAERAVREACLAHDENRALKDQLKAAQDEIAELKARDHKEVNDGDI